MEKRISTRGLLIYRSIAVYVLLSCLFRCFMLLSDMEGFFGYVL